MFLAVPMSLRASRSPKGRYKVDLGVDSRLAAIELRLASAENRLEGAGKLVEQLGAFAADVLHNRGEADLRIETLAGAQQASLAKIEGVLGAKLSEIEAAFGRCDAALKELQKGATTWPPGMPGSSQRAEEPPSLTLLRQRVDELAGAALFDRAHEGA